ncbi:MAG TPA: rod shape-determining protein MreD [Blastocatellia bacterium]|nr:rod shape-determining protein MreD [Blastocatellia bacterium]
MEKVSRGSTLKITVCLFAAAYLQTTLAQQVSAPVGRWLGHISWLLLVVVYIALQRDPVKSLMTAAAAGIIHDAFSMGSGVGVSGVGVNGLAMVIAAYVTDRIASVIMVDNLIFRFLAVTAGSVINTLIRLAFYGLLKLELPVLANGRRVAETVVFDLFANLFASVLLYIALDRVFNKGIDQRRRRMEARRLRPRL